MYIRYKKGIKSTSSLIRYINTCKILITLPTSQSSNSISILEYNSHNWLNFLSDNNKKDINLGILNNSKVWIKSVNINNDKEDIKLINIDNQKPTTLN